MYKRKFFSSSLKYSRFSISLYDSLIELSSSLSFALIMTIARTYLDS